MSKLKESIKSIPLLGWFSRWVYNILRINNTKYRLHSLEQRFLKLSQEHQTLSSKHQTLYSKHQTLTSEHNRLTRRFDAQEQFAQDLVRKHISSQLVYFHEKIDTFIENTNQEKAKKLKEDITQDFFDEYYLNFENKFRGSRDSILKRYENYLHFVPFLNTKNHNQDIKSLDIGCGRGEWVQLLQERGVDSYGIDMNPMMLKLAQENELKNIQVKDAFEYLRQCEDNTFDLITAFHIIEHIPFEKLVQLLQQIKRVAKTNATILLETPNPQNLQVAACNFYTDPTHLNPLPANMIKFLVQYLGFTNTEINYLNPNKAGENITANNAQDYLIVAQNSLLASDKVKKKLFFDVSLYHKNNLKTGIHRVVSEQLNSLKQLNQNEYEIIPVYLKEENQTVFFELVDKKDISLNPSFGDILFTSDLSYSHIHQATQNSLYDSYKKLGVKIVFLVHDILPILYEDFFVKGTKEKHETYIKDISQVADLLITTTQVGKEDLENYCQDINCLPKIEVLPLGSNISIKDKIPSKNNISNTKTNFLMVGTIEPRKAHKQVIKAFDILWENSTLSTQDIPTLTIIGKQGWLVEDTIKMIEEHPLLNKNLFYIEKASDEELLTNYSKATAVIMASYAEGFGLPLVEAIHHKKPIIARDIKVFREIADTYPRYFKDTNAPEDLASVIKSFINEEKNKETNTKKQTYKYLTWKQHTKQLLDILKKLS